MNSALCGDDVERGRRAEVDDHRRAAVPIVRGRAIDDAVGADFLRIVDVNGDAGLHARLDEQRIDAEVLPDHER